MLALEQSLRMRALWTKLCCFGLALLSAPLRAQSFDPSWLASLRPDRSLPLTPSQIESVPRYELDLRLADNLGSYALDEQLTFINTGHAPLSDLVLRLFGNEAGGGAITLVSARCLEQKCHVTQPSASAIRLQPSAALAPGAVLRVHVILNGKLGAIASDQTDMLQQGIAGLSMLLTKTPPRDYGLLSQGDGIASLAHFYAVVAQREGNAWVTREQSSLGDVGADGVSFVRATIHAPRDVTIASSGVATEDASDLGEHRALVIASLVRDFALVASRALTVRSRVVDDVVVRSYFLPADAISGERVLDTAARALATYQQRFGPYPFRELNVAEAALIGGAGGSEFSGFVEVASMLYRPMPIDPSLSGLLGLPQGSPLEFTTAHEVAHQYWYGLVGSDARQHPFADESLAQWSAQLFFEDNFGVERAEREGDAQIKLNYQMMRQLGDADGAVDRPVDSFASPIAYAGLVYGKGAYLYSALRKQLGDDAFFTGLRAYVERYRFAIAPEHALIDRLASDSGHAAAVRAIAHRWLFETHGDRDLAIANADASLGQLDPSLLGLLGSAAADGGKAAPLDPKALERLTDQLKNGPLQGLLGELL
ncbi:MAG TPA: M1 family aminopeptidase, partial [Polyangiales bacterium]|nr:M1 family aminopeptidase [Polyangiales bacterium]